MAAGSPSSATVPNFNPDEYRPPLHAFEPVGLKLYKPKATIYDDEVVLREPEIHFSVKNREVNSSPLLPPQMMGAYFEIILNPKEYFKVFGGSGKVNWDVWAGLDPVAHANLLRSRQASSRRILLEGPFCRQWYLGERVVRQSLGYDFFKVPKPIPLSMLRTWSLTIEDVGHWTEGEDAAIFLEEFGDYEEYRAQRLMSVLGVRIVQRGPPLGSQVRAVPTAVVAGGGGEVLVGAVLELPKLSWPVDYVSSTGHTRYVDVPSPEHVDFTLPPGVQRVPREYVEAWFRRISGLRVLVREQAMAGKTVRPPIMVEGSSFVVADRGTMAGTCEDKATTSAHTGEQPSTSTPPQTPPQTFPQIPISWPSDSILSLNWIISLQYAFEWGSRNMAPQEFPTICPATVLNTMIDSATSILDEEPNCIQIDGLGADSSVVVVGDVHGQLHDLIFLLRDAGFPGDNRVFVFNGDYVDRGAWGLETFLLLLAWKVAMPENVFLLRGNHESQYCTVKYGFKQEVLTKYGGDGEAVYGKLLYCFGRLPLASVIAGRVYTAHGGLFRSVATTSSKKRKKTRKLIQKRSLVLGSLEELNKANRKLDDPPEKGANLIPGDVLWSDPSMSPGLSLNEGRGMGLLWGPDCTEDFLKKFNLTLIIRSHEGPDARHKREDLGGMDNGYTIDHDGDSGKLITLFSAPDYPQFQDTEEEERFKNKGAYIVLEAPHFDSPVFHSFEAVTPRPQANPYYDYKNVIDSDEELDFASMES
ncbi:hypothetical protein RHSIM_Rhsim12G0012700 [Rhododendron simsii]|uniref:Serine/threonine-protein phosphatase n=1 Tax=Rhododendron simsii TaxID=118357 RepID=A0A834L9A5_RHOSS|nr:hypothetical protein RHSIM_Rhsim12G0012700 [Rhododendron simsii]